MPVSPALCPVRTIVFALAPKGPISAFLVVSTTQRVQAMRDHLHFELKVRSFRGYSVKILSWPFAN